MNQASTPSSHHAAAAEHHRLAAQFHREASRHYQIGKDYAHAAHQAETAHGHAVRARDCGQAASEDYAAYAGSPLPGYLGRFSGESTSLSSPIDLTEAGHHAIAGGHHDAACVHHERAEKHGEAEHFVRANHATQEALKHGEHALFHAGQAARHHMEHYGSQPSAERV